MEKGLILVNTGCGKGKTTAALGLLIRAIGHGKKCALIQFIKSTGFTYGERVTLEKLGVEHYILGAGCTWEADTDDISESIVKTWNFSKKLLLSGKYDLVVLDEINIALNFEESHPLTLNLKSELIELLKVKPENLNIMLTGRYAPPELISIADMVTEMNPVKHHYNSGVKASAGIEF
jgi:cob(I)alamin adenosyltransferase